ncbi:hypothetical protein [Nostoc sp. 'Peltigera membranacea cyanobiont' 232]|uniref:hypothetical protein n=1 Tax=Nostoc sp. 'Peltigera membranacea cyanobiont' 232 TaxID=2014531 RepID=UPI000B95C1FB|nr:hypothetical protein [Nostoc sp. 'Peltigera membranacea cyanobiont' 232]OYE05267.1 hypothetical protein CDG79_08565 [Nostoc sp. 'Peltigera membranacea cyanobiont' 232]
MLSQDFFNDEFLEERVDTFYGYGNYKGNYWFIGMEEAGGDFQNIEKRINIWSNRGRCEIDDVAEYHEAIGYGASFQPGAKAKLDVPVWRSIIRIVLSAKGTENIHIKDVREYQTNELGRKDKETCLLELLPLPSQSLKHWIYGEYSKLTFLSNRDTYENYCLEKRINHISQRIKEHQPKTVVFYGKGYEYSWRRITEKITDVEFSPTSEGFLICQNSQTVFVIAKHPVTRGITSEYFHNIGRSIAAKIAEK